MTNERAAKIILNIINTAEADERLLSISEIRALKKAYVVLNPEHGTNAEWIRTLSDDELAEFLDGATNCYCFPCTRDINNLEHYEKCKHESGSCEKEWLEWLKGETE